MIVAKKGAHGGNMVSPVLNREDALIMWKDPISEASDDRRAEVEERG
jgi:hypothetical protein